MDLQRAMMNLAEMTAQAQNPVSTHEHTDITVTGHREASHYSSQKKRIVRTVRRTFLGVWTRD